MKTGARKPRKPDIGAQMGDAIRARANKLTEAQREEYLARAMQMIYGNAGGKINTARR
ncbi:MAG: hypothetical protein LBI02_02305 [Opitutaceae bacterium]|jgi:hypothetical protein|nr:hypothetical protein [Opitutaceae bacterium]